MYRLQPYEACGFSGFADSGGEPFYLLSSTYADLAADNISFLLHQVPGTNAPIPALAQLWYIEDDLIDSLLGRCLLFMRNRQ